MLFVLGVIVAAVIILLTTYMMFFRSSDEMDEVVETSVTPSKPEVVEEKEEEAVAGPLTVFFGSQTGTAEGFAEQIKQEGTRRGFKVTVADLEDFSADEFNDSLRVAIMVMATYGEGEPTDNASTFIKWCKECDFAEQPLKGLKYTVFGLGNTQYEQYNQVAKDVDKKMSKLGADRCYELGLGDDNGTLEEDFEAWKEGMWASLVAQFHPNGASGDGNEEPANSLEVPTLPYSLKMLPASDVKLIRNDHDDEAPANSHHSTKHFFTAPRLKIVENRELRGELDGGSTRHIEVDIHNTDVTYQTADNLAAMPENDEATVLRLAEVMGWDVSAGIQITPTLKEYKLLVPSPCSVKEALSCFTDLHGMPRRTSLKDWAPFARNEQEAETLVLIASKSAEGKAKYKSLIEDRKRSLFEVITQDFTSMKVPLDHFLHLAPRLQPRYYTISSSSNAHPNRIHLTVSVIEEERESNAVFRGVCSGFMQNLEPPTTSAATGKRKNNTIDSLSSKKRRTDEGAGGKRAPWPTMRVFVRPSSFRLPADTMTPIILVGPGTGIAPMRALLQERAYQKAQGSSIGEVVLYFGCKNEECDYLYADEIKQFQEEGVLSTLHLAISRPGYKGTKAAPGAKKMYVQHLMSKEENAAELWDLIDNKGAFVYVCGGTSMGSDVSHAVTNVIETLGKRSKSDAEKYMADLKSSARYVQELWA